MVSPGGPGGCRRVVSGSGTAFGILVSNVYLRQ